MRAFSSNPLWFLRSDSFKINLILLWCIKKNVVVTFRIVLPDIISIYHCFKGVKINNVFWENYVRNSKKHFNLDSPSGSWAIDPNNIFTSLTHYLKLLSLLNFNAIFWVPWTMYYKMHKIRHVIFQDVDYFDFEDKTC